APEAAGRGAEGVEGRVDADREADLLGAAEDAIVVGMARRLLRHHEGRDEDALHAVARRALELALRLLGDAEGEVRDGDEAAAAVAAEVDDPAVVGARVGLRQLQVLALGLPEDAERRVEDADGEVLAVEPLEDVAVGVDRAIVGQAVEHAGRIMKPRGRRQRAPGGLSSLPARAPRGTRLSYGFSEAHLAATRISGNMSGNRIGGGRSCSSPEIHPLRVIGGA